MAIDTSDVFDYKMQQTKRPSAKQEDPFTFENILLGAVGMMGIAFAADLSNQQQALKREVKQLLSAERAVNVDYKDYIKCLLLERELNAERKSFEIALKTGDIKMVDAELEGPIAEFNKKVQEFNGGTP